VIRCAHFAFLHHGSQLFFIEQAKVVPQLDNVAEEKAVSIHVDNSDHGMEAGEMLRRWLSW
jgi:glutamate racemase